MLHKQQPAADAMDVSELMYKRLQDGYGLDVRGREEGVGTARGLVAHSCNSRLDGM